MAKIPKFKTEEEEIEFWNTHSIADFMDDVEGVDLKFIDKRPGSKRTTIYLRTAKDVLISNPPLPIKRSNRKILTLS